MANHPQQAGSDALRERLGLIVERYSQAEVARRVGTSRVNIYFYLNGTRMPGELLAALVKSLDVNPFWLLTGEGAPWLSDAVADTSRTADDLLELVTAMNALVRNRMGALSDKHHAKVLRDLNRALRDFEELRARVNASTAPIMAERLRRYRDVLNAGNLPMAEELRRELTQLSRLCRDEELAYEFLETEVWHEAFFGSRGKALGLQRRIFQKVFAESSGFTNELCKEATVLCAALGWTGRYREARGLARSVLALHDEGEYPFFAHVLQCRLATCEMELGDMNGALGRYLKHYGHIPPDARAVQAGHLVRLRLLSGIASFEEVWADEPAYDWGRSDGMLSLGICLEDGNKLRRITERFVGLPPGPTKESPVARYAFCLADVLQGDRRNWRRYYRDALRPEHERLRAEDYFAPAFAWMVQLPRVAGDTRLARENLEVAVRKFNNLPKEVTPGIAEQVIHHRNVLALVPARGGKPELAAARTRADEFFRRAVANGFGALGNLANP